MSRQTKFIIILISLIVAGCTINVFIGHNAPDMSEDVEGTNKINSIHLRP